MAHERERRSWSLVTTALYATWDVEQPHGSQSDEATSAPSQTIDVGQDEVDGHLRKPHFFSHPQAEETLSRESFLAATGNRPQDVPTAWASWKASGRPPCTKCVALGIRDEQSDHPEMICLPRFQAQKLREMGRAPPKQTRNPPARIHKAGRGTRAPSAFNVRMKRNESTPHRDPASTDALDMQIENLTAAISEASDPVARKVLLERLSQLMQQQHPHPHPHSKSRPSSKASKYQKKPSVK